MRKNVINVTRFSLRIHTYYILLKVLIFTILIYVQMYGCMYVSYTEKNIVRNIN